ncbi:conserved hypothetical protein [Planktothrix serta PCC 8927]|uniref:Uncharacterized protein n=1 Tax=Planktothrix serta PCC 8927 TaxID=671068 RepID=A0A7Z9E394_9CYAN|nr:hypothetical protein [Planktothrix serta]VXD24364.1 conserved hypothetical protein [Planktothrix serta PCC 8927]
MAYNDFTLKQLQKQFNLKIEDQVDLFTNINPVSPTKLLQTIIEENLPLAIAISTEKARSELLIMPILLEVRRQLNKTISLFSGTEFNVDPSQGLNGYCDFILTLSPQQITINSPIITIIEAKNENIKSGLGQCASAMIAAQLFNQQENNLIPTLYGSVTTGTDWKFLTLEENRLKIDRLDYYINDLNKIIGILIHAIKSSSLAE